MSRVFYFWRLEIHWPLSILDLSLACVDAIVWAVAISRVVR